MPLFRYSHLADLRLFWFWVEQKKKKHENPENRCTILTATILSQLVL
jgi:hypothetical protein